MATVMVVDDDPEFLQTAERSMALIGHKALLAVSGNQAKMLLAMLPEVPRLLILEQPTRGLDVESARWVWSQLLARRDHGAAILFSSDDLDELLAYSDRILVCFAGQTTLVENTPNLNVERLGILIGGGQE